MAYELLMLERHEKVGLIRLNHPEALLVFFEKRKYQFRNC
jgi:hypothetical protein